jgi:ribonuclease HI
VVSPDGWVKELGGGDRHTTNNRMELMGVIAALEWLLGKPALPVDIHTDSTYVIRGITQWVWGWRNRDWKTAEGKDVQNVEHWKRLIAALAKRGPKSDQTKVSWHYVRGHTGVPGNERCDEISVQYAERGRSQLYDGPLLQYGIAIHDIPEDTSLPDMRPKEAKVAAHSYLSLLGGTPMRHATWGECERRVKGQSGAKFKKTTSAADEAQVLASWGYKPSDLKG